jgi:hypothetical protein
MRGKGRLAACAFVLLVARDAYGDDNPCPDPGCHVKSPSTLTTQKGTVLALPPGYFLDEETWARRDLELKEAQDLNTRLKAENSSFRKSADATPWKTAGIAGAVGIVAGVLLLHYL